MGEGAHVEPRATDDDWHASGALNQGNALRGQKAITRHVESLGQRDFADQMMSHPGERCRIRLGGEQIAKLIHRVRRNGTLAVFLVRKVPVPFTLANVAVGASTIRYRDFIVGTTLGMIALVVALAGFGYQLTRLLREPSAASLATAALFVAVPVTLALLINRAMQRGQAA